jgi:transcriptional regulator with XRE-family HTH domain
LTNALVITNVFRNKVMFNFTKDMAKILSRLRKNANLTQKELANRMGIKTKYGQSLIAQIEMGKVSNPSLRTILDYLRSCSASWSEFFKQLDTIDFKLRHEQMIAQLPIPPESRKVQRAAMRYEIGVEFPSKEKEEIDFEKLKNTIKDKVSALVNKEEVTLTSILSPNRVSRLEKGRFDHPGRGGSTNLSLRGAKRRSNLKENTNKEIATLPTVARNDELRKINEVRGGDAVITAYQRLASEFFNFLAALNKSA